MRRRLVPRLFLVSFAAVVAASGAVAVAPPAAAFPGTTAWQSGSFVVDTPNLVRRSDIVLGRPNATPAESMPLGNGALGAAVWAANGLTAQLNRSDTFPDRKSLGQLVIPGLSRLTGAADFTSRLDLYDGMLRLSGGGMTLTSYVRADAQQLVVEVTGADPNATQTAQVSLQQGRAPAVRASGPVAVLAETWTDSAATGSSGRTFGTLAGVSAGGRNVVRSTPDGLTARVSFQPNTDGSFRVVVAAPTCVNDPTSDIATMQALFPVAVRAAQTLGVDADLVNQLNAAIPKIRPWPRTDTATQTQLLGPESDAAGNNMIGMSAQPTAPRRNSENIGLEAVWPYELIGDTGAHTALGRRTYTARSYVTSNTWSYDALHAARLGLPGEMRTALLAAIRAFQVYPSGMASFTRERAFEPYIEHIGVLAATVAEGLVQHYDGLLRIAPSWPSDWTGEGTVAIAHNTKVHVQVAGGTPTTVAIAAGSNDPITVRSPWPGQSVSVVDGQTGATVVGPNTNQTFTIPVQAGRSYLVERTGSPTTAQPFQALSGTPASNAEQYDRATIGIPRQAGTGTVSLRARVNGRHAARPDQQPVRGRGERRRRTADRQPHSHRAVGEV